MISEKILITNQLGLHARAAAQLVKLAGNFESRIKLLRNDNKIEADAKSILSLLTLAASKETELTLLIEGDDEEIAARKILKLFKDGFGEI